MLQTHFNAKTRVIKIKYNNKWLNGYNEWLSLITQANYDCQFLLTKDHAISIIYYIMKYISKPEAALHIKLTIAAAVCNALQNSSMANYMLDVNILKQFLFKTYNKYDTHQYSRTSDISN
jgi:hypothetical protein